MNINFFESVRNRMPHFFYDVDALEYSSHNNSKLIKNLFVGGRYFVISPVSGSLVRIEDNTFKTVFSINFFQYSKDYLDLFTEMHRVSSKFVMFSCATAGTRPASLNGYYKNLTESDFYNKLDLESMFDTYKFHIDYPSSTMYFWGVKRIAQIGTDKV